MIKYALVCDESHEFESWFPDSEAFEALTRRGLVVCPECNSAKVRKALMSPNVVSSRTAPAETQPMALIDDKQREVRAAIRDFRKKVEANTDDVGEKFPEVARAIHAGDEPERAIRGRATLAEAKALMEEGVGVLPLPNLPDEAN